MVMPQHNNPMFVGDSDENDNDDEIIDDEPIFVDPEELSVSIISDSEESNSTTAQNDSENSPSDSGGASPNGSAVSPKESAISDSDSADSPVGETPDKARVDANGDLPIKDVMLTQNGGVENKAFVPDEGKHIPDEESKKSFLPVNGTKEVNGHVVKKDEKKENGGTAVEEGEDDPNMYCGLGSCRPSAMQRCKTMGCFTLTFSLTGIVTSALSIYINSQITTLEKHFDFSSSVSGYLMSCNDLGYLSTTLFMSYYTRRLHIPRALAISTIIYGISGLMCTIAFFGTRDQLPSPPNVYNNFSSATSLSFTQVCNNLTRSTNATCEEISSRAKNSFEVSEGWRTAAIVILAIGMILQGVAKSPRHSFLATYVDDNVPKTRTTAYLGTMVGLSIFGPAVAFLLGGVFSKMYITLEETNITPRDPRWLGAWWLGFLLFGGFGLVAGIPLIFFPKRMRRQRQELEDINRKAKLEKLGKVGRTKFLHDLKGLLKAALRLVLNPIYVCLVLASGVNLMGVSGMMAFMPKYMETQFMIPAWHANMLLGAMNVLAASGGTILGGCLTARLKLSPLTCLKVVVGCVTFSTILMSMGFIIGCDQPIIESGLDNGNMSTTGVSTCVHGCNCDDQNFFPVCGGDGRNYFSPCHAGCSGMDASMAFTNCSCLATNESTMATGGLCEPDCGNLYPYMGLTLIGAFIITVIIMPGFVVSVRCVQEEDKPFAIGLSAFCSTLLGWFPGPVIFGALVDTTCLIWKTSCDSVVGACSLYDIVLLRFRVHALMTGLRCVTILLYVVALLVALCSKKPVFVDHMDMSITIKDNESNGNWSLEKDAKKNGVSKKEKETEKEKDIQFPVITDAELRDMKETSIV